MEETKDPAEFDEAWGVDEIIEAAAPLFIESFRLGVRAGLPGDQFDANEFPERLIESLREES